MKFNPINKSSIVLPSLFVSFFVSSCGSNRNGKKLYVSFFGSPTTNCIQIINSQDHQSFDDASAWLHFKTCSAELTRLLSQKEYSKKIYPQQEAFLDETATYDGKIPKWWTPSKLGDSCNIYEYFDREENTGRRPYVSID